jgi:hypothetical protein
MHISITAGCLILALSLANTSCNQEKATEKSPVTSTAPPVPTTTCYALIEKENTTAISMTETGNQVTGLFAFEQLGTDGSWYGNFTGTREGEIITVVVEYTLKGQPKVEEVVFRRTGKLLMQARGEMVPRNGKMVYADKYNLIWSYSYALTDCAKIATTLDHTRKARGLN